MVVNSTNGSAAARTSQLSGKVIAITGAASGMGLSIARLLAARGATLSLADLNEAGMANLVQSLENAERHIYTEVDVTQSKSVNKWVQRTVETLGRLDGAVNFAGVGRLASVIDETDEGWDFIMDVNAKGVFNCLRAQLRVISEGGSIVSAASIQGHLGWELLGTYCASKHAVIGLSRSAAREHPHVRINCVAPGVVATPMTGDNPIEMSTEVARQVQKRQAAPVEIGYVVAFLLSDEASFVTGATWDVDGGFTC